MMMMIEIGRKKTTLDFNGLLVQVQNVDGNRRKGWRESKEGEEKEKSVFKW